jgi:hypothetical protein
MNFKLPTNVTRFVGRNSLLARKNSPQVLFAAGVTGFIATTVLASRATLKSTEVFAELEAEKEAALSLLDDDLIPYSQEDYNQDLATLYAVAGVDLFKLYGPALVVGGLSIAALTGSHHILNKRNAGLSAAYAAVDKAFTQYRSRVRAELGEEKDNEFRHGHVGTEVTYVNEEDGTSRTVQIKNLPLGKPSMYAKYFDELNKNYEKTPEYNRIFLKVQQDYANDMLRARGHIFLNEVYDMLGIDRTGAGSVVGWVISDDGDNYVDFGLFNRNDPGAVDFVNGREGAFLLDFNVDGVIWDLIEKPKKRG